MTREDRQYCYWITMTVQNISMYERRGKAAKAALGGKLIALNVFIENNRNLKSISWDPSKKLEKNKCKRNTRRKLTK